VIGSAARSISRGEIDQRVTMAGRDEFGNMARDLDSMTEYLHSTVEVARAIAADNLDVEVRPRSERDALGNSLLAMTARLRRLKTENERLLSVSRREANTDSLTPLPNRRAFMRDIDAQLGDGAESHPLILALFDLNGFKHYNDTFGHPAGDELLARLGARLQRALAGSGTAYRMGGDEFCVLARPARERAWRAFGAASLRSQRLSASREIANVLLKVLDERGSDLHKHVDEVAWLATRLARRLGLPKGEVARVDLAAAFHDIGKLAIPEAILNKPAPLDEEEWGVVQRHTMIGERIVEAAPSLALVADLVRSHHERYDGAGYPDRLAGEEIPSGASIIATCDAFAVMTSERPYSAAVTVAEALAELRRCAGSQFDSRVVDAFCELIEESRDASPQPHDAPNGDAPARPLTGAGR
jgi:diguanylate cyclase (GGDEF)-like protein